jgi:hypothetical protein
MQSKGSIADRVEAEDKLHQKIIEILSAIYEQDVEGGLNTDTGEWETKIKHGIFEIDILHPVGKNYVDVVYEFELDGGAKSILKDTVKGKLESVEFEHGLRSALTFPNTFYYIHMMESGDGDKIPEGFVVGVTLFPFTGELSVDNLSKAIQNVAAASALGISFFGLKMTSYRTFMEFLKELNSSPEGMYR